MNFDFGNLVSSVIGAVASVVSAVSDFFSPTADKVDGTVGSFSDMVVELADVAVGVAEAVIGAQPGVADVNGDGSIDADEAEKIVQDVLKVMLGGIILGLSSRLSISSDSESQSSVDEKNVSSDKSIGSMASKSWNSFKEIGGELWNGIDNRRQKMFDSKYDFFNWETIGIPGTVKSIWEENGENGTKAFNSGSA